MWTASRRSDLICLHERIETKQWVSKDFHEACRMLGRRTNLLGCVDKEPTSSESSSTAFRRAARLLITLGIPMKPMHLRPVSRISRATFCLCSRSVDLSPAANRCRACKLPGLFSVKSVAVAIEIHSHQLIPFCFASACRLWKCWPTLVSLGVGEGLADRPGGSCFEAEARDARAGNVGC